MKKNILIIIIFNLLTRQQSLKNQKGFPYNNSNYGEDHYNQKNPKQLSTKNSHGIDPSNTDNNQTQKLIPVVLGVLTLVLIGGVIWSLSSDKDGNSGTGSNNGGNGQNPITPPLAPQSTNGNPPAPGQAPSSNTGFSAGNPSKTPAQPMAPTNHIADYEKLFDEMFYISFDKTTPLSSIPIYLINEKPFNKIQENDKNKNHFSYEDNHKLIKIFITKEKIEIDLYLNKVIDNEKILTYLKQQDLFNNFPILFQNLIKELLTNKPAKFLRQDLNSWKKISFNIKDNQIEEELINILNTIKNDKYFNFYKLFEEKLNIKSFKENLFNEKDFDCKKDYHVEQRVFIYGSSSFKFELFFFSNFIAIEIKYFLFNDNEIDKFKESFRELTKSYNGVFNFILNLTKYKILNKKIITFNIIENDINPQDLINLLNIIEEKQ